MGGVEGLEIAKQQALQEGEELIGGEMVLGGEGDSFLGDFCAFEQFDDESIDLGRGGVVGRGPEEGLDDVMSPQFFAAW